MQIKLFDTFKLFAFVLFSNLSFFNLHISTFCNKKLHKSSKQLLTLPQIYLNLIFQWYLNIFEDENLSNSSNDWGLNLYF